MTSFAILVLLRTGELRPLPGLFSVSLRRKLQAELKKNLSPPQISARVRSLPRILHSPLNTGASAKELSMNRRFLKVGVLLCTILACASFLPTHGQDASKKKLTNQDVLDMVSLGLGEDVILEKIRSAPQADFDTSIAGLTAVKHAKVSDAVIRAMINPPPSSVNSA